MFKPINDNDFMDLKYFGNDLLIGKIIYVLTGNIIKEPTRTSIQIAENNHIEDSFGRYINHNCDPNIKVIGINLIAIKEIKNGDSITFNYNDSEDIVSYPFLCSCCNKMIVGKSQGKK